MNPAYPLLALSVPLLAVFTLLVLFIAITRRTPLPVKLCLPAYILMAVLHSFIILLPFIHLQDLKFSILISITVNLFQLGEFILIFIYIKRQLQNDGSSRLMLFLLQLFPLAVCYYWLYNDALEHHMPFLSSMYYLLIAGACLFYYDELSADLPGIPLIELSRFRMITAILLLSSLSFSLLMMAPAIAVSQQWYSLAAMSIAQSLFFTMLALGIPIFLKRQQLKQSQLLSLYELSAVNHEQQLLQVQLDTQEQTYTEISREIHDHVAISLTLCKLNLNTLEFTKPQELFEKVNIAIGLLGKTISTLNHISKTLDTDCLEKMGLVKTLEYEIQQLNRPELFATDFRVHGPAVGLPVKQEIMAYRIILEAINNIIRHAEADTITITLNYCGTKLECCVEDDGKGFDTSSVPDKLSSGINNMNKRAQLIDAALEITSITGQGTLVKLSIPIINNKENNGQGTSSD